MGCVATEAQGDDSLMVDVGGPYMSSVRLWLLNQGSG